MPFGMTQRTATWLRPLGKRPPLVTNLALLLSLKYMLLLWLWLNRQLGYLSAKDVSSNEDTVSKAKTRLKKQHFASYFYFSHSCRDLLVLPPWCHASENIWFPATYINFKNRFLRLVLMYGHTYAKGKRQKKWHTPMDVSVNQFWAENDGLCCRLAGADLTRRHSSMIDA